MVEGLSASFRSLLEEAKRSRPLLVKLDHVGHTGAQSHDLRVLAERRSTRARPRTVSVITPENEPAITVNDIEVAQFHLPHAQLPESPQRPSDFP